MGKTYRREKSKTKNKGFRKQVVVETRHKSRRMMKKLKQEEIDWKDDDFCPDIYVEEKGHW